MPLLAELTQLTALTLVLLLAAAFVAGWVDAVVGGGGLIQLPALLTALPADAPTGAVLGTNKVASAAGTAVASLTYVRRLPPIARTVIPLVLCALAGSAVGAAAVADRPPQALDPDLGRAVLRDLPGALRTDPGGGLHPP